MPRPGTDITIVEDAPGGSAVLNTGQAFFIGTSERGPADRALKVSSLRDYAASYGTRSGGSLLYDSVGAYFTEAGSILYVSRIISADALASTIAFGSLTAHAASPGAWGDGLTVAAEAPATQSELLRAAVLAARMGPRAAGDPVVIVVSLGGVVAERSPTLASADNLVTWAQERSDLVRFVKGADNLLPAAGTTADLAGGTNGTGVVDHDSAAAALGRFDYALGPGQVAAPGLTAVGVQTAVGEHVHDTKRVALLDLPDSADPTVLAAAVGALQGSLPGLGVAGVRFAAALGTWAIYPTDVQGATVVVPYSGIQAGLIAVADAGGNPNEPAAGANGVSRGALGLAQTFNDEDREALNEAGIIMAKPVYGDIRTYGYRTAAGPDDTNWLWFSNSRVIMAIAHEADAVAEAYVLRQIDGKRRLFAKLEADLRGVCLAHFNAGALYGDTPEEAFTVDTGNVVNTVETIAAGEIHAVIRLRCSPAAEWVSIEIVKVPVTRAVAA